MRISFAYQTYGLLVHSRLVQTVKQINGKILLANGHLLFWLSLMPFVTGWMGENHFTQLPVMLYGIVTVFSAIAYFMLSQMLIAHHGKDSPLAIAIGKDKKGIISLIMYISGVFATFIHPYISCALYLSVSIMWLIPDKRIEKVLE